MDPRGGGGGVLQISSDMDDKMGAKIETQKNPMPILQAIKISRATTQPGHAGTITNLQIVSNTPKNSYLNQAPQKNTCQNFPTQTKSWNQKFQTQKNPLIIPVTWNPKSLPPTARVMDPGSYKHFILTFVKQAPPSP